MNSEELARSVSAILGPASATSRALAELERRRAAGECVEILEFRGSWIVGPADVGTKVDADASS